MHQEERTRSAPLDTSPREAQVRATSLPRASRIKAEEHHVAVFDDVLFAFVAGLAVFLGGDFAAEGDVVVVGDGLGADEAAFEVGVDDAGRLGRAGALMDGPG